MQLVELGKSGWSPGAKVHSDQGLFTLSFFLRCIHSRGDGDEKEVSLDLKFEWVIVVPARLPSFSTCDPSCLPDEPRSRPVRDVALQLEFGTLLGLLSLAGAPVGWPR